jgi:hypothetical protein
MKTKAKIILKSLAELPADAFAFVASVPERALTATQQMLAPPGSGGPTFAPDRYGRGNTALTALPSGPPWPRGGLNE